MITDFQKPNPVFHVRRLISETIAAAHNRERLSLTPRERRECERWKIPARKNAYLAGRILAKTLIQEKLNSDSEVEILSRTNDLTGGCAPRVYIDGRLSPWNLSLSHTGQSIAFALCIDPRVRPGIDLVSQTESIDNAFRELWFHRNERENTRLDGQRCRTIWAVKEAAFKALASGAPFRPQAIQAVERNNGQWLAIDHDTRSVLSVTVRTNDNDVLAIATYEHKREQKK